MHSSLIGKVEKAKVYARERDRIRFDAFAVTFRGENSDHVVSLQNGAWNCNCDFFSSWQVCSHSMALEKVLEGMVPTQPLPAGVQ